MTRIYSVHPQTEVFVLAQYIGFGRPQTISYLRAFVPSTVFEEITMTSIFQQPDGISGRSATSDMLDNFPVGGADPDFNGFERIKPAVCSIPVLGKILSQCK